jgi:formylglycine-generating enzyme required for sulfatase activity
MYRLPTESEWEYAARAGTNTAFYLGNSLRSGQANFNGTEEYDASKGDTYNPNGIALDQPTPVGSYPANPWGLYDMIGNVYEWCQDWYDAYSVEPGVDPQGAATGLLRVLRGGRWRVYGEDCRSATRNFAFPDNAGPFGIRVVLAPIP